MSGYREESPQYQDVWDWDIILYPDGTLRVICFTTGCVYSWGHYNCDCPSKSRMSSPIVDEYNRPLKESPYYEGITESAKFLLDSTEGSEIPVMSGKTYRLTGPRDPKIHARNYAGESVWKYYEEHQRRLERELKLKRSLLARFFEWINL